MINQQILDQAVERTIRPLLIGAGRLDNPKQEGWHHQSVIPKAQPKLTREALAGSTAQAVTEAIRVHGSLLSRFEVMRARRFVKTLDDAQLRSGLLDLLYGKDDLEARIRRFLDWAGERKLSDGEIVGFNATSTSYLLAMSDPTRYAFCKPSVYSAAAKALLGEAGCETEPVKRVVHTTAFYAAALERFRHHNLPFSDLMHSHIAFWLMHRPHSDAHPAWGDLNGGMRPKPVDPQVVKHPLNMVLYGPPGTGKTWQAIRRAIAICEGKQADHSSDVTETVHRLREEGRLEFVTFHQSFGYEDFVEGIRPLLTSDGEGEGGEVRYECREGIFKKVCDMAREGVVHRGAGKPDIDPAKVNIWKMSLGNTLDPEEDLIYQDGIEQNRLRLGYGYGLDFTGCDTRDGVRERLQAEVQDMTGKDYHVVSVHALKNRMQRGDLVIVSHGNHKFRAIGVITGDYQRIDAESYEQVRPVQWLYIAEETLPSERITRKAFSQATIHQLSHADLKLDALRSLLAPQPDAGPRNHVLIIDEINRGNIAKIFGELITLLEPDKRIGQPNELRATLPYSAKPFGVPANLYIIGTMNTADRSIALLDTALRRRFRFKELMPDPQVIRTHVGDDGVVDDVDVAGLLQAINDRIELLYDRDHQIGHSYFLDVETLDDLRQVFLQSVIPLLQEYFYGDWAKVCAVLGCPYDEEAGTMANDLPLILARPLNGSGSAGALLPGAEGECRMRCQVDPAFLGASAEQLPAFFECVGPAAELVEEVG